MLLHLAAASKMPSENEMGPKQTSAMMAAVAVKLPTFYPGAASFWFLQADCQFTLKGVTSPDTRYHYVVTSLSQEVARRMMPTLEGASKGYKDLKKELLHVFLLTDAQRTDKLLELKSWNEVPLFDPSEDGVASTT